MRADTAGEGAGGGAGEAGRMTRMRPAAFLRHSLGAMIIAKPSHRPPCTPSHSLCRQGHPANRSAPRWGARPCCRHHQSAHRRPHAGPRQRPRVRRASPRVLALTCSAAIFTRSTRPASGERPCHSEGPVLGMCAKTPAHPCQIGGPSQQSNGWLFAVTRPRSGQVPCCRPAVLSWPDHPHREHVCQLSQRAIEHLLPLLWPGGAIEPVQSVQDRVFLFQCLSTGGMAHAPARVRRAGGCFAAASAWDRAAGGPGAVEGAAVSRPHGT